MISLQIISNLYHNFPNQRILIVTHSNQALNDLFEKILERDIKEHHLLRLGAGEKELATSKDFSKWGRVNHALQRRMDLLAEVCIIDTRRQLTSAKPFFLCRLSASLPLWPCLRM